MQVIYNFGRDDASNRQALVRLAASVVKILEPAQLLDVAADGLEFVDSQPFGAVWVLDALWRQLELDGTFRGMRRDGALDPAAERVLFALVASRALAGSADPPAEVARWVNEDVFVDGLPATTEDACRKVTKWLCEVSGRLQEEVFHRVADRLDLKADLLFFESAHGGLQPGLGLDGDEDPQGEGSKDAQSLAPPWGCHEAHQTVIGLAVTRTGIPLRIWRWPGCTDDAAMIRQAKEDMKDWTLSRVIRTADRGRPIAADRHALRKDDDHPYIVGAKLRSGSAEADAALSRQGRYHRVAANLRVKEVHIAADERFVICRDTRTAQRDAEVRTRLVEELSALIDGTDRLSVAERTDLHMEISANPRMRRYLRLTPGGLLRIDVKAVKAEENLDGKYLVRTTDPELPAEEIALGYMRLLECERTWRDLLAGLRRLKSRGEPGDRGHLLLTWLSLLLVRIAESRTGLSWSGLRREFDRIKLGTFAARTGLLRQRTEITEEQYELLAALGLAPPPRIIQITPSDGGRRRAGPHAMSRPPARMAGGGS
ncbi:transposase [Nonomuraea sp. NEAU-A123]|uniref:IS1634 family transposase n=1 Tax=Nonomuraea sp. NEAU-A123 TaxID=2839649 RepID=UPI001BE454F0|nr:transposase [Nonomuraea sp. NEAU-A123]MBT2234831.1 transposase [Nonomuraea sp. NEAU-A123]